MYGNTCDWLTIQDNVCQACTVSLAISNTAVALTEAADKRGFDINGTGTASEDLIVTIAWELYGMEIKETYTVEAYYCPMTMPTTLQSTYTYDPNMGTTLNIDASAADNGSAELH